MNKTPNQQQFIMNPLLKKMIDSISEHLDIINDNIFHMLSVICEKVKAMEQHLAQIEHALYLDTQINDNMLLDPENDRSITEESTNNQRLYIGCPTLLCNS
jgi:hypothetical protein